MIPLLFTISKVLSLRERPRRTNPNPVALPVAWTSVLAGAAGVTRMPEAEKSFGSSHSV